MNRKTVYLSGVALGIFAAVAALHARGGSAEDTESRRQVAPSLQCNFEGYEGIEAYEQASRAEHEAYALGMGYANSGSDEIHAMLHAAFSKLDFDPVRTPIVSADLATGRLHVFDCATERCTREEIARAAPLACVQSLGAGSCVTFAVRVQGNYYCTLGPGLGQ